MTTFEMTRKDARKARDGGIKKGDTVYTIETSDTPLKGEQLIQSWHFNRFDRFFRTAMCGSMSAEALVLNYGPVYTEHPSPDGRIRCMFEKDALVPEVHLTPAELIELQESDKKRRRKPARR